jgi:NAD(P)H-flavin reductase
MCMAAYTPAEHTLERGPMVPVPFRVSRRWRETPDTWTLELEPLHAASAVAFAPGQFNMLGVVGRGEVPISISGDPDRPQPLVHTVRAVGAATAAICAAEPGQVLGVRGPFGRPWPVSAAEEADVVIVTGGIGLAPLRPAIYELLARRGRHGRVVLLYGGRQPDQLLFSRELERWRERGAEIRVSVDTADPSWRGSVGVVTKLIGRAAFDPASAVALVCGPEVMMRFTIAALDERGVRAERIHVSLERNMQCAIGHCGHCQLGPTLLCRDGPVYRYADIARFFAVREL